MKILEHRQHRLAPRELFEQPHQGVEHPLLAALRRQVLGPSRLEAGHRQQIGEQRQVRFRGAAGQQGLKLAPPRLGIVVAVKARRAFELAGDRIECAFAMMRRAEIAHGDVRLARDALAHRFGQARLAEAGIGRDQHGVTLARLAARPAAHQHRDLRVATDQRRGARAQRLEAVGGVALAQHPPGRLRRGEPLHRLRAEVDELEQVADLAARRLGDQDGVGPGERLQARRKVGRLADHRLFLGRTRADPVAHDDESGGDADAHLQRLARRRLQAADGGDDLQAGPHGALGFVLVGARIAEIGEQPVAHELGDEAVMARDDVSAGGLVGANHVAHVLRIEA